jgi:hypothetical protein
MCRRSSTKRPLPGRQYVRDHTPSLCTSVRARTWQRSIRTSSVRARISQRISSLTPCAALVVGMIVMMWPALTKVQYERIPSLLPTRALWEQVLISLVLNWVIAPFVSGLTRSPYYLNTTRSTLQPQHPTPSVPKPPYPSFPSPVTRHPSHITFEKPGLLSPRS